jgi:hypothetical protein
MPKIGRILKQKEPSIGQTKSENTQDSSNPIIKQPSIGQMKTSESENSRDSSTKTDR